MKNINMKKLAIIAGMFMVFAAVMLVLNHSAKNGRETIERLPSIPDSPIYVECIPNETLEAKLTMKEDLTISGFKYIIAIDIRGYSSAGRVLDWQSRGHGFEPRYLHQKRGINSNFRLFMPCQTTEYS